MLGAAARSLLLGQREDAEFAAGMRSMAKDTSSHNPRILVVEDDPSIGALIAAILEEEGYEPVVAKDGGEALRILRAARPDAVTLDLELPGIDGRAVLRWLWENGTRAVPVIVVSAATEMLSREERRRVLCALRKPFEVPELVRAVSRAVACA
jgi:CheY-like chemotaxis protein